MVGDVSGGAGPRTEPLQPSYVETSFREHEPVGGYRVASARQGTLTIRVRPPRSAVLLRVAAVWNAFVCVLHYFVGVSVPALPALLFLLIFDLAGAWLVYVGLAEWVRTTMTIELSPSSLGSRQRPIPMQRAVAADARSIRDIELTKHTIDDHGTALSHRLVAVTDRARVTIAGLSSWTQRGSCCTRYASSSVSTVSTHRSALQRRTS